MQLRPTSDPAGVSTWADVLSTPRRPLASLALCDCEAKDEAALTLATALRAAAADEDHRATSALECLDLASNQFTAKGVTAYL